MKRLKANQASLVSDFHRASPEMTWLRLYGITNESTEIENCYSSLNRELLGCGTQYIYVAPGTDQIKQFRQKSYEM